MLTQLTINNFAIVHELATDFHAGMTAITGETGAGKSIAIDALTLCLGGRAEAEMVRPGSNRADLCARFSLADAPDALHWLETNQLDEGSECLMRRTISADGRSRGYINGTAVPLSQLRELGQRLIQIHGQHAHQLLLKGEQQLQLLDSFMGEHALSKQMAQHYRQWRQSLNEQQQYQQQCQQRAARMELLSYQLGELNEFNPQAGEFEQIDKEYRKLANSGQLQTSSQQLLQLLAEDEENSLQQQLHSLQQQISELAAMDDKLADVQTMLADAAIQISEASIELRHYCDNTELDPARLAELEKRLSLQISLARKHHVPPAELPALHQQLLAEQQQLDEQTSRQQALEQAVKLHQQQAQDSATQLHQRRLACAEELQQLISESMRSLAMPHGQLVINSHFDLQQLTANGADSIEFRVTLNPGQPLQALNKVASGGELSRIALAILVITARKMSTPALIFDEIDTGISGSTAAVVGKLLRTLGETTQVICVTHLPQVAGCGHQHFLVSKQTENDLTKTCMQLLDKPARLQELARLLGGSEVTKNTLANARELLAA